MIFDVLKNISRYQLKTMVSLQAIQDYIYSNKVDLLQLGRFDIDGDRLYGIVLEYETQVECKCLWEAHRQYLDVHYIVSGSEIVNVSDVLTMEPTMHFDLASDYQLFRGTAEQSCILGEGDILILFPNECHQTGIQINKSSNVKKIVFKFKLNI